MATRRTQPQRANAKRPGGRALRASQKGSPAKMTTAHERRRAALRKKKGKSRARRQTAVQKILAVRRSQSVGKGYQ